MPRTVAALLALAVLALPAGATLAGGASEPEAEPAGRAGQATAARKQARERERVSLGRSVRGRRISAVRLGDPEAERKVLVVGEIHGEEPAGRAIARLLERGPLPRETELWVLSSLNPDGHATGTRQNARGVDLNRNFPFRWRPLPRGRFYSGPRPASEPETRIAQRLIRRLRPELTLWFHQPYGFVVRTGADPRVERRVARLMRLPLRRLPAYPGTASSWQHDTLPGTSAIVVELRPGPLAPSEAGRYARAVRRLAP